VLRAGPPLLPAGSAALKRSAIGVLFLTVFIDLLGFGIVLPLLPRYGDLYGVSGAKLGLLMASFSAMQFFFSPFWGKLSDRVGRRPVLMVGLFGSVASYTLFGLAHSYGMLLVSRIAAGLFGATIATAQAYIADVTGHHDRGKEMALIGAAFGIGFTVGPALGGFAHGFSPAAPGFVAAGLSAIAFLCAWRVLPEPERHVAPAPRKLFEFPAVRHALHVKPVLLILALQVVATFCFANFEATLALLSQDRWHYDIQTNGLVFTYVGFCMLLSQGFLVRRFMPKVGEVRFVRLGTLLLAGGLTGLALGGRFALLALSVVGFSMIAPSLSSLLSRWTPPESQGEILGLGQSGLSMARILGPFIGLILYKRISPETPYWVAVAVLTLAFAGALLLRAPPQSDS